jgi:hypothetical protein
VSVLGVSTGFCLDDDLVGRGVAGDNRLGRLTEAAGEAALVDEGADEADAEGTSGERALHSLGHVGLTVEGDEALELLDLALEIDAPASNLLEIDATFRGERGEAVTPTGGACSRALLEHGFDVSAVLDGVTAPPAALVLCDDGPLCDDTHGGVVGSEVDTVAHEAVRNGVGVGVSTSPRHFATGAPIQTLSAPQ